MSAENETKVVIREEAVSHRVKSRKTGVTVYKENPFWDVTQVEIGKKKVTIAGGFVADTDTGEGVHHAGIHRIEEVDEDKFVKIFTQNIKAFFDLSAPSLKVLQIVMLAIQNNKDNDGIWLSWFDAEEQSQLLELGISKTTFHRGLKEMLEKGFIAESEKPNYYFINPHLFFNGSRMTFIREYRKKETKVLTGETK